MTTPISLPIFDLHCDLLSYLASVPGADVFKEDDIGCAYPHLKSGNVKWQVLAIYSTVESGSTNKAFAQSVKFTELLQGRPDKFKCFGSAAEMEQMKDAPQVGVIAAIENAAGFCEEEEKLDDGFRKLENIMQNTGRIFYIGITHHGENRFGGGNFSKAGLKDDGRHLLEYLNGRQIAIDLAHTSDALAHDVLDFTAKNNLNIPIIASHSNFRAVHNHVRNLPDEIVKEIIFRKGLIGINLLRAYVNTENPEALFDHFQYGLENGAASALAFGADFFYTKDFEDKSRIPLYFSAHENAGKYPVILTEMGKMRISQQQLDAISHLNVMDFIKRSWK
jgi:microsomal dipeptidase-like Zn-dependent dipeptidase